MTPREARALRDQVDRLDLTLRTLILWIVQSSVSPINVRDAERLLGMLDTKEIP